MEFLTRTVHLPSPLYRSLPALYLVAAFTLWLSVDHLGADIVGIALAILAGNIWLKRLSAR